MAIGVALSSLDVVVGISGVHYVLQGLRQIDNSLEATNKKKVRAAIEFPDTAGQIRKIEQANSRLAASMGTTGSEIRRTMSAIAQPVANPFRQISAREAIGQVDGAKKKVQDLSAAVKQSQADMRAADAQLNAFLRGDKSLQRQINAADTKVNQVKSAITKEMGRDFRQELAATQTGQRWLADPIKYNSQIRNFTNARTQQQVNNLTAYGQEQARLQAQQAAIQGQLTARGPQRSLLQAAQTGAGINLTNNQGALQAGQQHLAQVTAMANAARQYLAQTASFLNPVQWLSGVLGGVVRVGMSLPGLLGGILNVGKGLFEGAGHAAMFVGKLAMLPAITGPVTGGLSLIAENFRSIITAVGLLVGALAALSFKTVIQEGIELEQAFSNIGSVAQYSFLEKGVDGKAAVNVDKLKESMVDLDYITLKLGADTVFSNTEVARTIEMMLRGGVSVPEVTEVSVKAILDLSTATGATLETSAGVVNDLIGMWGIAGERIPALATMIAGAVNTSRMSTEDFMNALRQVGPLAQAMGISPEDVATSLTMLADKGFRGEIAGTAYRNMLLYLNPRSEPAKQAMQEKGLWTDTGMSPASPEDLEKQGVADAKYQRDLLVFQNTQTERKNRLATLQAQLNQQQSAAKPNAVSISRTQNQIEALMNDINTAQAPTKKAVKTSQKGTGHSKFYNDDGSLKSMPEIIDLIAGVGNKLTDQQQAEFYQDVFGTRSGSAALLFSQDDSKKFTQTKDLISSIGVDKLANFRLDNVAGMIELLVGSLQSLAGVVFINWLASPLKGLVSFFVDKANVVLEFFGKVIKDGGELQALFGSKSRGAMLIDQLGLQLATGNLEAFMGNLMAIVPQAARFDTQIRRVFRGLQLGRDTVITFAEAFQGKWKGVTATEIPALIRIVGIFGTYWGNIWRSIFQLLRGEINFTQFFSGLSTNFKDLLHNLGMNLSLEGPGIWEAIKAIFKGTGGMGETIWKEAGEPGMKFLWDQLKIWWKANGPNIQNEIGGVLNGAFDFLTRRKKRVTTEVTYDEFGQPTTPEYTSAGALDYLDDFITKAGPVVGNGLGGIFSAAFAQSKTWLETNKEPLLDFGKGIAGLIGEGLALLWSDDGVGMGRALARMLAGAFTQMGVGLLEVSGGIDDLWASAFGAKGSGGGGGAKKASTGIGEEFKRAFIIMGVDILLILNILFTSFLNLFLLLAKEVLKGIFGVFMTGVLAIVSTLGDTPAGKIMKANTVAAFNAGNKAIDDFIGPGYKIGVIDPKQFETVFNQESIDENGIIQTGPNRGKKAGKDGQPLKGPPIPGLPKLAGGDGGAGIPGKPKDEPLFPVNPFFEPNPYTDGQSSGPAPITVTVGPDGSIVIGPTAPVDPNAPKGPKTPGSMPLFPAKPGSNAPGLDISEVVNAAIAAATSAAASAQPIQINAYGLGADQFLDEVTAKLAARRQAAAGSA